MIYKHIFRPLLFALSARDPEIAHEWVLHSLRAIGRHPALLQILDWLTFVRENNLQQRIWGLDFPNPVGLAAGMDKDGLALPAWQALNFGWLEIGGVVLRPQSGNPRPRIRRFPQEESLYNRMGFNSAGVCRVSEIVQAAGRLKIPVGFNIGKNRQTPIDDVADDYCSVLGDLWPVGDYFVINISSPNTPGLRQLQDKELLTPLLKRMVGWAKYLARVNGTFLKPILVKVASDITDQQLDEIQETCVECAISGLILGNTRLVYGAQGVMWGLSGPPLQHRIEQLVLRAAKNANENFVIVAVGGINSPWVAYRMLDAGAQLIQVLTGLVYEGPLLPRVIVEGLVDRFAKENVLDRRQFKQEVTSHV